MGDAVAQVLDLSVCHEWFQICFHRAGYGGSSPGPNAGFRRRPDAAVPGIFYWRAAAGHARSAHWAAECALWARVFNER